MLAAQTTDIDGLEAAHAPVILHLHPGKPLQNFGHLQGSRWQVRQRDILRRTHRLPTFHRKNSRRSQGVLHLLRLNHPRPCEEK